MCGTNITQVIIALKIWRLHPAGAWDEFYCFTALSETHVFFFISQ